MCLGPRTSAASFLAGRRLDMPLDREACLEERGLYFPTGLFRNVMFSHHILYCAIVVLLGSHLGRSWSDGTQLDQTLLEVAQEGEIGLWQRPPRAVAADGHLPQKVERLAPLARSRGDRRLEVARHDATKLEIARDGLDEIQDAPRLAVDDRDL